MKPTKVLQLWETTNAHRLSSPKRAEFLARAEVSELSRLPEGILRAAAQECMTGHGVVLLGEWLVTARARVNQQRPLTETGRAIRERARRTRSGMCRLMETSIVESLS